MKNVFLLALLISLSATTLSCAQTKMTQKEKFQSTYNDVKTIVQSKAYRFVGEVVYNNKKREVVDSETNLVSVDQDEVSASLNGLSNTQDIKASGRISNYNVNYDDDKLQIAIEFKVGSDVFYIDIKPNGNAFLAVKSGVNKIAQVGKIIKI